MFNVYDPRFVTPYPDVGCIILQSNMILTIQGWKFLIEAQQTILEATTFVHDLDQTAKSSYNASWIPSRMQELDSQIISLLLLCRGSSMPQTSAVLDSPEIAASRAMRYIAEIKLQRYFLDSLYLQRRLTKPAQESKLTASAPSRTFPFSKSDTATSNP